MSEIEIKGFYKQYGDIEAVKGIDLSVRRGELFGLIGPDGAGKTTMMRTIATLLVPGSGSVRVKGMEVTDNISQIRSIIGYMPQRFSLYQDLTVQQNLLFFADLFTVPAIELSQRLDRLYRFSRLEPFKNRKAGALSGGMKQKLALSCALIHTPDILVLDEPTFGVDPVSRKEFWDILRSLQQDGTTILVSTAYMDEANQCDRVAFVFDGRIRALGKPSELRAEYPYPLYRLTAKDLRSLSEFFNQQPQVHNIQLFGDALHISFESPPDRSSWHDWQESSQGNLLEWHEQGPSIEDVFLDFMGRKE